MASSSPGLLIAHATGCAIFAPSNSRCKLRTEQTEICGFVCQSPDWRKALVNSSSCQAERFQVKAKSKNYSPVQHTPACRR